MLDSMHSGRRDMLMSSVSAFNALPRRPHGLSPECLWRALRPLHSQWRQKAVDATLGEEDRIVTDEEWLQILDDHAALGAEVYKDATAKFAEDSSQLQKLFHDAQERHALTQRVKAQKRKAPQQAPIVTGDRVLSKSTQYRSTSGYGKFETDAEGLCEFTVVGFQGGIATLQDPKSGKLITRHESLLRVMPQAIRPEQCSDKSELLLSPTRGAKMQELETLDRFWVLRAKPDGACLFRSICMSLQSRAGVPACYIQDNDAQAEEMRLQVVQRSQLFVQGCSPETDAEAREALLAELEDEPLWDHSIEFTWSRFFDFLRQPRSYSTSWCLGRLAELHSASLKVLQYQCVVKGDVVCDILEEVWTENGEGNPVRDSVIWLLRTGQHYDLLLPRRLQKRK